MKLRHLHTLYKYNAILVLGFLFLETSSAQTGHFIIYPPQQTAENYIFPGNINEALITIRPVGVYAEIGLELTLSVKPGTAQTGDSLQASLAFMLPENSIVNGYWLWVDSTLVEGKIQDRWAASTIYQHITQGKQDPSILTKDGQNYRLRIYPLFEGQRRKIKINYLVPCQWSKESVQTPLPLAILRSSRDSIPYVNIQAFLEKNWENPALIEASDINFQRDSSMANGDYFSARLTHKSLSQGSLNFSLAPPLTNGAFVVHSGSAEQGYFQMVALPDQVLQNTRIDEPERLLVLIQNQAEATPEIDQLQLLEIIKKQLQKVLEPDDFFSVISTSPSGVQVASPTWLPASFTEINRVFTALQAQDIQGSTLIDVLKKGIEFFKNNAQPGKIILFANSSLEGSATTAYSLVNELDSLRSGRSMPFFIADYATSNTPNYLIGGFFYYGNRFFYLRWISKTEGVLLQQKYQYADFSTLVPQLFNSIFATKGPLDVQLNFQNGTCFGIYELNSHAGTFDLTTPLMMVGRYQGTGPFEFRLSGANYRQSSLLLPLNDLNKINDELGENAWTGNFIQRMEKNIGLYTAKRNDPDTIQRIVAASRAQSILSNYTAFVCLQPGADAEPCQPCMWMQTGGALSTRNAQDSLALSKISPNPFRERVMIQLKFEELIDLSKAHIAIYNHLGQMVRVFKELPQGKIQDLELQWDGTNGAGQELPAGVYIFRLEAGSGHLSKKLIKLDR